MIPDDARRRWLGPKPEPPPCRLGIKVKPWGLRGSRRNRMALQRQRDRKAILDDLLAAQDGRCHWCGVPIVRVASIPPEDRLAVRANTVVIATQDGEIVKHVATLDHLEGPGVLNGVASCATCNRTRAERPKTFERWLERRRSMVRNFKPGR